MTWNRHCIIGLALGAFALALTGCTPGAGVQHSGPNPRTGSLSLVAYDSCDAAMKNLKAAARIATRQYRGAAVAPANHGAGEAQTATPPSAPPSRHPPLGRLPRIPLVPPSMSQA